MGMVDAYAHGEIIIDRKYWLLLIMCGMFVSFISVQIFLLVDPLPVPGIANTVSSFRGRHTIQGREPTPRPRAVEDVRVVMEVYSLQPNKAEAGTAIMARYEINATGAVAVGLDLSIRKAGTSEWISDPANNRIVDTKAGTSVYFRRFLLPPDLEPGAARLSRTGDS